MVKLSYYILKPKLQGGVLYSLKGVCSTYSTVNEL